MKNSIKRFFVFCSFNQFDLFPLKNWKRFTIVGNAVGQVGYGASRLKKELKSLAYFFISLKNGKR